MADSQARNDSDPWNAASRAAAAVVTAMAGINCALMDTSVGNVIEFLVGALIGLMAVGTFSLLVRGLLYVARRGPTRAAALLGGAFLALWFLADYSGISLGRRSLEASLGGGSWHLPASSSATALASIVLAATLLAATASLARSGRIARASLSSALFLMLVTGVTAIAAVVIHDLARDGSDPFSLASMSVQSGDSTGATADPTVRGRFEIETLTYGWGDNPNRPEFGAKRTLESRAVDASVMFPRARPKAHIAAGYWGFGLAEAPLNGTAWLPRGDGPFPLALIVHGNHGIRDASDSGFAYLAELLASHGVIAVSVDQNFLNGVGSGDFRGTEMPARAWLLLEHLRLWRDWNATDEHPLFGRVDMENIALLGHSRGGEAVSMAYAFNQLERHPDDATVEFNFGFSIRSLVAIAQVDQRYHRRLKLENVNFLTLHGSYDSDEPAYHGMRQYNRIEFVGDDHFLKAGIYIHGANHSQFNTVWGRTDYSPPNSWLLNLAPIIRGEEQRQVAKSWIGAFLAVTLQGKEEYLPLLRDPRRGSSYLPPTPLVAQYTDSSFLALAQFEQDLDVATAVGGKIIGRKLAIWREEGMQHRDGRRQGSNVVILGWNSKSNGEAEYGIEIDRPIVDKLMNASMSLSFAVSGCPETVCEIEGGAAAEHEQRGAPAAPAFSIELIDGNGEVASLKSSDHLSLAPPLRVRHLKDQRLNKEHFDSEWEAVLQHVELPLALFSQANAKFDAASIRHLRFRFDQLPTGVVILDDIGFIRDSSR